MVKKKETIEERLVYLSSVVDSIYEMITESPLAFGQSFIDSYFSLMGNIGFTNEEIEIVKGMLERKLEKEWSMKFIAQNTKT